MNPPIPHLEYIVGNILEFFAPESWPPELLSYLDKHHALFLEWESQSGKVDGKDYDKAIYGLRDILHPHTIIGWHCTRLTESEREVIIRDGMRLPDADMLSRRIDALVDDKLLSNDIANRFRSENQSSDEYRAGRIWFCFFPPRLAGEHGISRFFRSWGGEALYNRHENALDTGPALRRIGLPSIVEAVVPISTLRQYGGVETKFVRQHLIYHGFHPQEPVEHEDCALAPLSSRNIKRIITYSEPDFAHLTGCDKWGVSIHDEARK